MPNAVGSGLCRVTVVAPRTRIDLALPEDVPLADLQPTLLRYAGEDMADEGTARGGWVLAKLGGALLDSTRTVGQLGIRDGEQLYFTPRSTSAPDAVFDDVVDAIATATQDRGGQWAGTTTRAFGVGAAVVALVLGMLLTVLSGPPHLPGAIVGLGVGLGLVIAAAICSRALSQSQTGLVLALLGIGYGATGGLLLVAGDHGANDLRAPDMLIAGAVVLLYSALASAAVGDFAHVLLAAAICGAAMVLGGLLCLLFGMSAAGAGGIVGSLALAATPALPTLAFRLGRLPMPTIPAGPDELRTDSETVDGRRVLAQSDAADRHLTGLLGATAVVGLGAELCLALGGDGWPRLILLMVLAVVLVTRSRSFSTRWQRLPLMIAGMVGVGLAAVAAFTAVGPLPRLLVILPALIALAVVCLVAGLALGDRRVMPVWTRLVDVVEVLLIVAIIPLALWVCGAYAFIRAVKG
ncbi:MAG: type VII secretion integral membrane protein EccD [Actinocatenispora sp.]